MNPLSIVYGSSVVFAGGLVAVSIGVIYTNDEFSFILVL